MSWVVPPSQSSWTAITQVWRSGWRPPISLLCLKRLKATIGTWVVYIHQRALWVQAAAQADRFQQKEGARPVHIKFPEEVFSDQCEITRAKGCQTQGKGHHQVLLVTVDRWFLRMRTLASHHHDEPTTPLHTKTTPQHHEEAAATRRRKYKEQACFFFFTMASCGTCMRYCAWGRRESRDLRKLSWRAAGGSPVTAIARRQKAISRRRERQRCTKERQREQAEQKRLQQRLSRMQKKALAQRQREKETNDHQQMTKTDLTRKQLEHSTGKERSAMRVKRKESTNVREKPARNCQSSRRQKRKVRRWLRQRTTTRIC